MCNDNIMTVATDLNTVALILVRSLNVKKKKIEIQKNEKIALKLQGHVVRPKMEVIFITT